MVKISDHVVSMNIHPLNLILSDPFVYNRIPAKHINPMAINPVRSIVMPNPLKGVGMLEYCSFLRMAAMAIIARAQPAPDPKPKTTDSGKV